MVKESFCSAEDWGFSLLAEQLEAHTLEKQLEKAVRTKTFFTGLCKESMTEGKWKKKNTGKQHRNNCQNEARVLQENQSRKTSEKIEIESQLFIWD